MDHANFLEDLIALLNEHSIRYCVIGGQGVNAYADPLVSLDLDLVVVEDVLAGKIWAVQDPRRRPSKRRKDLLDIERLIEAHPELRSNVPVEILGRIFSP